MNNFVGLAENGKHQLINSFQEQGHTLTGSFEKSLRYEIKEDGETVTITYFGNSYGMIVNNGIPPQNIPYTRGSGAKTSLFIKKLRDYGVKRGIAKPLSFAFAVANKAKKEGIPLQSSSRFSKTGKRTNFIQVAKERIDFKGEMKKVFKETMVKKAKTMLTFK